MSDLTHQDEGPEIVAAEAEVLAPVEGVMIPAAVVAEYGKIATYQGYGVSDSSIMDSLGIDSAVYLAILEDPAFKEILARSTSAIVGQAVETDASWDSLENQAVQKLDTYLKMSSDPEFNLKVAVLANKAQRRTRGNVPLDPGSSGSRAVITLSQRMIQKLGASKQEEQRLEIPRVNGAEPERQVETTVTVTQEVESKEPSRNALSEGDVRGFFEDALGGVAR